MSDIIARQAPHDKLSLDKLVQDALKSLPRSQAWEVIGTAEGLPRELRGAIKDHAKLSKRLERLQNRRRHRPHLGKDRACKGCGLLLSLHRDRAVKRRCLHVIKLKYFVARDWERNWSDPLKRRQRMQKAWDARRAKKDKELLDAIHPHVRATIGDTELLRRLGRRPELEPASALANRLSEPAD